jgi:hypothetical protein
VEDDIAGPGFRAIYIQADGAPWGWAPDITVPAC